MKRCLLAAVLAVVIAGTVAGCADAGGGGGGDGADAPRTADTDTTLGHVHGLGIDPADDTLYIASHMGLFQRRDGGQLHRVADRWQDTMAFTVVGPNHFLASGHPDLREDLPPHLGLIESTDAAETWQPLSLQGKADFHALEVVGDQLFGYDSASESLLVTTDQRRWRVIDRTTLVDITVVPGDSRLLATTPQGRVVAYDIDVDGTQDRGGQAVPVEVNAPPLVFLDWVSGDEVAGLAPDGATYLSPDGGRSWRRLTGVPGEAQAIDASPETWHVATSTGVYQSTDEGRRWTKVTP